MATCDLSIIIVSWNVWPLLEGCLRSLEQATQPLPGESWLRTFGTPTIPATLEVIVVDNASGDATAEQLPRTFPWVRFVRSDVNLGFTGGNNLGYRWARGECIYFLNPDTAQDDALTEQLALERGLPGPHTSLGVLYGALLDAPDIAVVGPQLRYGDGSRQSSARRFPTPLTGFFESTWLGRAWPGNPWARRMHMDDWDVPYRHDVDWVVGAAMLCRRTALEEVITPDGPFDERFFMYSEELDLCRRLKQAGWRVRYAPEAAVTHYEGKSSEQVTASRHIRFNTSKVQYYQKWMPEPWPELLRRYLLLEFRVQIWIERAKWLLGHKRPLREERIRAYRQVIASGLR